MNNVETIRPGLNEEGEHVNENVIEYLEETLRRAKEGNMLSLFAVGVFPDGSSLTVRTIVPDQVNHTLGLVDNAVLESRLNVIAGFA